MPIAKLFLVVAALSAARVPPPEDPEVALPPASCALRATSILVPRSGVPTNALLLVSLGTNDAPSPTLPTITLTGPSGVVPFAIRNDGGPTTDGRALRLLEIEATPAPLAPNTRYTLRVGGVRATFQTGRAPDAMPPVLDDAVLVEAVDETTMASQIPSGIIRVGAILRVRTTATDVALAEVTLRSGRMTLTAARAPLGREREIFVGLNGCEMTGFVPRGFSGSLFVRLRDRSGNVSAEREVRVALPQP